MSSGSLPCKEIRETEAVLLDVLWESGWHAEWVIAPRAFPLFRAECAACGAVIVRDHWCAIPCTAAHSGDIKPACSKACAVLVAKAISETWFLDSMEKGVIERKRAEEDRQMIERQQKRRSTVMQSLKKKGVVDATAD